MPESEKVLFDSPFITVLHFPWRENQPYTVVRPRTGRGGTVLAIIPPSSEHPESRILVVSQDRPPIGGTSWELPAGGVDEGETGAQGAAREFSEETGILVRPEELVDLGMVHANPAFADDQISIFAVMLPSDFDTRSLDIQADEINDYAWLPASKALELFILEPSYSSLISTALLKANYYGLLDLEFSKKPKL